MAVPVDDEVGRVGIGDPLPVELREDDGLVVVAEVLRLQGIEGHLFLEVPLGRDVLARGLHLPQPFPHGVPDGVELPPVQGRVAVLGLFEEEAVCELCVVVPQDELPPELEHGVVPSALLDLEVDDFPGAGDVYLGFNDLSVLVHAHVHRAEVVDLEEVVDRHGTIEMRDLRFLRPVEEVAVVDRPLVEKGAEPADLRLHRQVGLRVGALLDREEDVELRPRPLSSLLPHVVPREVHVVLDVREDVPDGLGRHPSRGVLRVVVVDVHGYAVGLDEIVVAPMEVPVPRRDVVVADGFPQVVEVGYLHFLLVDGVVGLLEKRGRVDGEHHLCASLPSPSGMMNWSMRLSYLLSPDSVLNS